MLIPAGATDVVHSYDADPTPLVSGGEPFMIRGVSLHMHQLGVRGTIWVRRESGATECVLHIPRWDFSWQQSYLLSEPMPFYPGDRLGIECHWDNSAGGQAATDVSWGGDSSDEMCLGALVITPLSPP